MRTAAEATSFIDECQFALNHLFAALKHREDAIEAIAKKLSGIEYNERFFRDLFIEREQWSANANYLYMRYHDRMKGLADEKRAVATEADREQRVSELLARIGATEEAMAVLAGSILQIGKQALSYRFGTKPVLAGARAVGSQSVVDLIWEGRNHALHWEESNPRPPVRDMLAALQNDLGLRVVVGENNAVHILKGLGWTDANVVASELKGLIT